MSALEPQPLRLGSRARVVEGHGPGQFVVRVPRGVGVGCGMVVIAVPFAWFALVHLTWQVGPLGVLAGLVAAAFAVIGIALLRRHDEIVARAGALVVRRRPWPWAAARTIPLTNVSAVSVAERIKVSAAPPDAPTYLMNRDDARRHRRQLHRSQNPLHTHDVVLVLVTRGAPVTEIPLITGLRDSALAEDVAQVLRARLGLAASWSP
jgi:hypothetical protein